MAFIDDLWEGAAENTAEITMEAPDDDGKVTVGEEGDDDLVGSRYGDLILGDPTFADDQGGDDTIRALGGDDEVRGFGGDNVVHGDAGDDRVIGSSDDDVLVGGPGADLLEGREGVDTFVWNDAEDGLDTLAD